MKRLLVVVLAALGLNCGGSGADPAVAQQVQQQAGQAVKEIARELAKGAWNGTIVIKDTATSTTQRDDGHTSKSSGSSNMSQTVTIAVTNGIAVGTIGYDLREQSETVQVYDAHSVRGNRTDVTTASGTTKDARVNVAIYEDGRYEIEYEAAGVQGEYSMVEVSQTSCQGSTATSPNCTPTTTQNKDASKPENLGGVSGSIHGRVTDPKKLTGTSSEPTDANTGNTTGKRTVTWTLYRK